MADSHPTKSVPVAQDASQKAAAAQSLAQQKHQEVRDVGQLAHAAQAEARAAQGRIGSHQSCGLCCVSRSEMAAQGVQLALSAPPAGRADAVDCEGAAILAGMPPTAFTVWFKVIRAALDLRFRQ